MTELYSEEDKNQASASLYLMMDRASLDLINNDENQYNFIKISKIAPCYEEYGRYIINTIVRTGVIKGKLLRDKSSLEDYIIYLNNIKRLTENQAVKWINNPTINPKNGKSIVKDGPLYKRIMKKVFNIANKLAIPKQNFTNWEEMITSYKDIIEEFGLFDGIEVFCEWYDLPFYEMYYMKWFRNNYEADSDDTAVDLLETKVSNYITLVEFKIINKKAYEEPRK